MGAASAIAGTYAVASQSMGVSSSINTNVNLDPDRWQSHIQTLLRRQQMESARQQQPERAQQRREGMAFHMDNSVLLSLGWMGSYSASGVKVLVVGGWRDATANHPVGVRYTKNVVFREVFQGVA
jgi:hypothetical protein